MVCFEQFLGQAFCFLAENEVAVVGIFNIRVCLLCLGGKVVELIGEFDLVISKFWYNVYNISFKIYHGLKNIKSKL